MTTLTQAIMTSQPRFHGQPMSLEAFAALPDDGYRYEYVKGVATMMSPAGGLHGRIAIQIAALLWSYFDAGESGHIFDSSTGYRLPNGDVRTPDVSVILPGRLPDERDPQGFIDIPPDLAVEVISPSERYEDIQQKITQYLAWGVKAVWIVEPATRTVTIHTADGVTRLASGDTLEAGPAAPGFACRVERLFPPA